MEVFWNDFMRSTAFSSGVVGLALFIDPERFANRIASAREIRRMGILMWLWVALYAIAYL